MLHEQLNAGSQVSYEMAGAALSLTFYNVRNGTPIPGGFLWLELLTFAR
jgi:hypothetical protein